uniref:Profilin (Fragments) n=1 Tax=Plantago lanceolata TaxID=39414 RepID=PROF_PLALA|nr:RecName: Full=Profilin; AltName: Allergen=Pla l 2 [Plantago lanceolata]
AILGQDGSVWAQGLHLGGAKYVIAGEPGAVIRLGDYLLDQGL